MINNKNLDFYRGKRTRRHIIRSSKSYNANKFSYKKRVLGFIYLDAPEIFSIYNEETNESILHYINEVIETAKETPVMINFEHTTNITALSSQACQRPNAVIQTLLKNDASLINNYRLIANRSFLSEIREKVVLQHLNDYLASTGCYDNISGFCPFQRTGTALFKVGNDISLNTDCNSIFNIDATMDPLNTIAQNGKLGWAFRHILQLVQVISTR